MKNVICVDLSKLNVDQIKVFCEEHEFVPEVLIELKTKTYAKIWFLPCGTGIAYNLCRDNIFKIVDHAKVRLFTDFLTDLSKLAAYEPAPVEVVFDVDTILEKIHKFGRQSITKEEKDFLDNL
jgi:hypothetical protein